MFTCCFTGHRPEKIDCSEPVIKKLLKEEIIKAIHEGYTEFITGAARGSDIWAGEIVIELKKEYKSIDLICAVPYPGFDKKWSLEWKNKYRKLLSSAKETVYIRRSFSYDSFQLRNKYMVDRSNMVIAVFNNERGGTYNTIRYAAKRGIKVINVLDDETKNTAKL